MPAIQTTKIRKFSGLSTLVNATDTAPGTLFRADGVNTVPESALSFGPQWSTAWGETSLITDIATALSGAASNYVHFVTISKGAYKLLVAWELYGDGTGRPRGMWQVAGTGDPAFGSSPGVIAAPSGSIYRNHTLGLDWYGSIIQNEIWLGNGTDTNLVWAANALAVLGPASAPTDAQDPSQVAFPPCITWLPGSEGQVYGAGNTTNPLNVWCGEIPNKNYPLNRGLKSTAYSYLTLQVNATSITGLSSFGRDMIVHLDIGAPQIIAGYHGSPGGWKLSMQPTSANASAINPSCTRDSKLASFYLGKDLELYKLPTFRGSIVDRGYNRAADRDGSIVTKMAPGEWQYQARKPVSGNDYFLLDDEKNGRTWIWMKSDAGGRQSVYCFDQRTNSITGPWRYPDFLSACQARDDNLDGSLFVGITRDGVLLWADVSAMNTYALPPFLTALPASCAELSSPPTPSPGIPYVGVSADGQSFKMVLNGQTLSMATPWSDWAEADVTCTKFYNNARVAVIEFGEIDCGQPALQKEFADLRTIWTRNSVAYVGVYADSGGYLSGGFRGLQYPSIDWINGIGGESSTVILRAIIITFNDQNCILSGVNLDWLASVTN